MTTRKFGITFHPLDPRRWDDFVALFGERGACGGCWCMTWRLTASAFQKNKGAANRKAMHALVRNGEPTGIIMYVDGVPAGWCSVAPREHFVRLEKARVLKRIDEKPVWSVTCFFVAKPFRRRGLSVELLKGVIAYGRKKKMGILEAYPVIPYTAKMPDVFAWTGLVSAFEKAGFVEAARPSKSRPIMRFHLS